MSNIPKVLTNKFVLTGLSNSVMKDSSLIKPIFGTAGKMGKVVSAPALASSKFKGTFKADLNATRSWGPSNLGKPNNILKLHNLNVTRTILRRVKQLFNGLFYIEKRLLPNIQL
ncbi:hypothetical protein FRACYDRAFT_257109 [Fragilariopsis cylindrus CCMP1102]|uniref:Uncharacterized protein n=1 Tax=Fragilariopsis cylindrus CCMP1102 TaxID=635003 RepID=A0A1E7EJB9_9STRA|nr:hypothetical protein FRACYDRAFT_257109 [Fragilariopsis cylindrus CCMP1102]|eukprot:OEU05984.1 hypothetical protein FRACYDRAFT_257109 [Fragilariopsis cylindrus CCMP1102]